MVGEQRFPLSESSEARLSREAWLDKPLLLALNWEKAIYILFIVIAIVSRFYDIGARVMSHDESLHTYFSYNLATGKGFQHTPLMHGPFLFHITALSYFLFGANDATSRFPFAVFGIVLVALPYFFRRWLGRFGALVTSFMILISPSILYHARYIRQEESILVWTLLTVLCVWRYLEDRQFGWLVGLSAVLAFHATDKSTSFLAVALYVIFLAPLALWQLYRPVEAEAEAEVKTETKSSASEAASAQSQGTAGSPQGLIFRLSSRGNDALMLIAFGVVTGIFMLGLSIVFDLVGSRLAQIVNLGAIVSQPTSDSVSVNLNGGAILYVGILVAITAAVSAGLVYIYRITFADWLRRATVRSPAFNVIIVMVTTTMFMASPAMLLVKDRIWQVFRGQEPVPISLLGEMSNLTNNSALIATMMSMTLALIAVAVAIGLVWDAKRWLPIIGVFLAITVTLFTTVFTNTAGVGSGFVGQLGYWMAQQDVKRGSQPTYYYAMLVPLYEYTVLIGALGAITTLAVKLIRATLVTLAGRDSTPKLAVASASASASASSSVSGASGASDTEHRRSSRLTPAGVPVATASTARVGGLREALRDNLFPIFLTWWTIATCLIYTSAGEKMPWLTVHFALPMALLTGWFLQRVGAQVWRVIQTLPRTRWLAIAGLSALGVVLVVHLLSLIGSLGQNGTDRAATLEWVYNFALGALALGVTGYFLGRMALRASLPAFGLTSFVLLSALTIRTAVMVTYINYDYVKEFLFYAHGAPGVKVALNQIDDLQKRLGGKAPVKVGYTQETSWPMSWYMAQLPGSRFFGTSLPSDFADFQVILASDNDQQFQQMTEQLATDYTRFDYMLVWWPMQDYFDLNWQRISYSLFNPQARAALWEIAFNRNYEPYAKLFNKDSLTPESWSPGHRFTMFVRNDVADQLWDYRVGQVANGARNAAPGPKLQSPAGLAFAPDGSRFVIDHKINRVFKQDADGNTVATFGGSGAQNGKFNDAWGVAVDPAGNVFVADTFNHRIQKFDPSGNFVLAWGRAGATSEPGHGTDTQFFGPRDIAFDAQGHLLVTDTGNKRVQVFDANGNFVTQFGGAGASPGQFNEPVGLAVDAQGNIYVADTWNKRVQVFDPAFKFVREIKIPAWEQMDPNLLQGVDHKPYLTVSGNTLIVTSPRTAQLLAFTTQGTPVELPNITFDPQDVPVGVKALNNTLYVTNQRNGAVLAFPLGAAAK